MEMKFGKQAMSPLKNAWAKFTGRIGRKAGQVNLNRDVKQCDYEDVHTLWHMLKEHEKEQQTSSKKNKSFGNLLSVGSSTSP